MKNSIEALEKVSRAAAAQIDDLKREREAWTLAYGAAIEAGDPDQAFKLQAEKTRLENAGPLLKTQALKAGIAYREARQAAAIADRDAAYVAFHKEEKKLQAAQHSYNEARSLAAGYESDIRDLQVDIASAKREFEGILSHNLAPVGPVVLSIPHRTGAHFSAL